MLMYSFMYRSYFIYKLLAVINAVLSHWSLIYVFTYFLQYLHYLLVGLGLEPTTFASLITEVNIEYQDSGLT